MVAGSGLSKRIAGVMSRLILRFTVSRRPLPKLGVIQSASEQPCTLHTFLNTEQPVGRPSETASCLIMNLIILYQTRHILMKSKKILFV